eukprot:gene29640-38766_t
MTHDIGGSVLFHDRLNHDEKALLQWEKNVHALLVVLSSKSPHPLLTTDELRRGIESLDAAAYSTWSYYEKWVSSMCIMLLERGVILESELYEELDGDSLSRSGSLNEVPKFNPGDKIKIRSESTRVRWRRPHIRCPGYVFGSTGSIVKWIGHFRDPYYLAFRGPEKLQHLYSVSIPLANLWTVCPDDKAPSTGDFVVLDVYEDWLERDGDGDTGHPNPHEHEHAAHHHRHHEDDEHHHSHDNSHQHCEEHDNDHAGDTNAVAVDPKLGHDHHHGHGHEHCEKHGHGEVTQQPDHHDHGHKHDHHRHATDTTHDERGHDHGGDITQTKPDNHNDDHHHGHRHRHRHSHDSNNEHCEKHDHEDPTTVNQPDHHHHGHRHGHGHRHDHHHHTTDTTPGESHDHAAHGQGHGIVEEHSHSHDHGHVNSHSSRMEIEQAAVAKEPPPSAGQTLAQALLRLLQRKGVVTAADIQKTVERLEASGEKLLGATLVATAWKDAAFKARLLENASAAASELGITTANANAPTVLRVMENTAEVHHVVVCTLCSCYPSAVLGLSPSWYKSSSYRARTVREPRVVLEEFGVILPPTKKVVVLDSTADCRYLVLPQPPAHIVDTITERSLDELRSYITRDSMIGVELL